MEFLLDGFRAVTWQQGVMYLVGFTLIYLAIQKDYEPALLLPMGFGAILVNLPSSGVLNQMVEGIGESQGIIQWLFETTIEASEALPLLLFIGIGAMIDFGPLLSNPKMLLFGAAAQFGIFFTGEPGTDRAAERMAFPCRAVPASVLCRVAPLFYGWAGDRPAQARGFFLPRCRWWYSLCCTFCVPLFGCIMFPPCSL